MEDESRHLGDASLLALTHVCRDVFCQRLMNLLRPFLNFLVAKTLAVINVRCRPLGEYGFQT